MQLTKQEIVLIITALNSMLSQPITFGRGTRKEIKQLISKLEEGKKEEDAQENEQ